MRTFKQDYNKGLQGENDIHSVLEDAFDTTLTKTVDPKHRMDFEGSNCWIEVKTRFGVSSKSYPTMLLPVSKILFALEATKPVYFVFNLTDGVFYIKFDEELFKSYGLQNVCRWDRNETLAVRHIHIPVSDLDWIQKIVT